MPRRRPRLPPPRHPRRHRRRPHAPLNLAVSQDLSSVRGEIEEAERREDNWDRFYEAKRKEMEEFQAVSRQFEAETREEVQRLRDLVSQLKSTLVELQSREMYSNNAEIASAEARKFDLTAKKVKLDESLASARQFRALLQQQLQKAFQPQIGDKKQHKSLSELQVESCVRKARTPASVSPMTPFPFMHDSSVV